MPTDAPPDPSSARDTASSTGRRRWVTSVSTLATVLVPRCSCSSDDEESELPESTPTRTAAVSETQTPEPTQTDAGFVAEVFEEYTAPLETVGQSAPRDSLDFLANTSTVGMGKATHGTREFMLSKANT